VRNEIARKLRPVEKLGHIYRLRIYFEVTGFDLRAGHQIRAARMLAGRRKPILPVQLDVTLGRFDIGRASALTRPAMSPLRSTIWSRRLIDTE
jgi:hypothetical protein